MAQRLEVSLLWDDRRNQGWEKLRKQLDLPYDSRLQDSDFIFLVRWGSDVSDSYLVGECSHAVDVELRDKVLGHLNDLGNAGHRAYGVLVG